MTGVIFDLDGTLWNISSICASKYKATNCLLAAITVRLFNHGHINEAIASFIS